MCNKQYSNLQELHRSLGWTNHSALRPLQPYKLPGTHNQNWVHPHSTKAVQKRQIKHMNNPWPPQKFRISWTSETKKAQNCESEYRCCPSLQLAQATRVRFVFNIILQESSWSIITFSSRLSARNQTSYHVKQSCIAKSHCTFSLLHSNNSNSIKTPRILCQQRAIPESQRPRQAKISNYMTTHNDIHSSSERVTPSRTTDFFHQAVLLF